ncbi:MAG: hypothetical protein JSS72_07880 [Armatimonadetes bacterium]|nr:hypothetical protein [Armatimonadota bacterium]
MQVALKVVNRSDERVVTEMYRPFFLAGVLSVLTAGCLLGALALAGISMKGSYTTPEWTPYVLAHANAQLYGWVGLFIMGFALQQHAPRRSKAELFYKLAYSSLACMIAAVTLRFVAEPIVVGNQGVGMALGVGASILQIVGVILFYANTTLTRYNDGRGLTWPTTFVFASMFWWPLVAIAEPFYFFYSHSGSPMERIRFVAEYFPPYREAQFLGFVAMMIFGVAFVKMSDCFGAKAPHRQLALMGFVGWTVGLLMRMVGWVVYFRGDLDPAHQGLYFNGGAVLAVSAGVLLVALRMFEPLEFSVRSHKFIRGSMFWLGVSGVLLILEPLHLARTGQAFSHAYIGAVRHAVTVGFISQMILGVGAHVVARMNDLDISRLAPLATAFWLLNLGNAGRVSLEILSDYTPNAFAPMGVTGFIELTGLVIWAVNVFSPVLQRKVLAHA